MPLLILRLSRKATVAQGGTNSSRGAKRLVLPADSLSARQLPMRVVLGEACVPLRDVRELVGGDVLPLDTRCTDGLPLYLTENANVVAYGHVCRRDETLHFQIKNFLNRIKTMNPSDAMPVVTQYHFAAPDEAGTVDAQSRVNPLVLDSLPVRVTAVLGDASVTIQALRELKEGDLVKLETVVDGEVSLYLNGSEIAHGQIVAVDENFGIRITRIGQA
ncbi:FliM/FliN family flagellar motor switch protein [Burkholderia ubonensis]|nr:FliM/FliN family flagellar motor switch protein [Burkholderia ubonensis]